MTLGATVEANGVDTHRGTPCLGPVGSWSPRAALRSGRREPPAGWWIDATPSSLAAAFAKIAADPLAWDARRDAALRLAASFRAEPVAEAMNQAYRQILRSWESA